MTWDGTLNNIFVWDGNTPNRPETKIDGWYSGDDRSQSIFGAVRLKATDNLAVILGTRIEDWERVTGNHSDADNTTTYTTQEESGKVIPYVGITYDFFDNWTAYASYTNIFHHKIRKPLQANT